MNTVMNMYYFNSERYDETLCRNQKEQSLVFMHSYKVRKRRITVLLDDAGYGNLENI